MKTKNIEKLIEKGISVQDKDARDDLGFTPIFMAMTTMLHSDPGDQSTHTAVNGNYKLMMTANPDYGLPFGSAPRLIVAYMVTQARTLKTPKLHLGSSYKEFMMSCGLNTKARNYNLVRDQIDRLMSCSVLIEIKKPDSKKMLRFNVLNETEFFEPVGRGKNSPPARVVLSPEFYASITAKNSVVPLRREALIGLRPSSLALDIYVWLPYRLRKIREPTSINWELVMRQFGTGYTRRYDFIKKFREHLVQVSCFYPELHNCVDAGKSTALILHPPEVPHIPDKQVPKQGNLF